MGPGPSRPHGRAGGDRARAVRDRRWKLVLPHEYRSLDGKPPGSDGNPATYKQLQTGEALYDLKNDGPTLEAGGTFSAVTGVLTYFYGFKIAPRSPDDFVQ